MGFHLAIPILINKQEMVIINLFEMSINIMRIIKRKRLLVIESDINFNTIVCINKEQIKKTI